MKTWSLILAFTLLIISIPMNEADAAVPKMTVIVDENNQSFIPVGLVKSYTGVKASFTASQKKIQLQDDNRTIIMILGQKSFSVNQEKKSLDAAPFRDSSGAVYIPLKIAVQYLNFDIEWEKEISGIRISRDQKSIVLPVVSGKAGASSSKPVTSTRKSFKVGSRSLSANMVTISLLHPKTELDVVLAHNKIGRVEDLRSMARRNQAVAAINGTFFDAYTAGSFKAPYGYIFSGGQMLKNSPADRRTVFSFNQNYLSQLIPGLEFKNHYNNHDVLGALQAGPLLVVNGKVSLDFTGFRDPKIRTGGGARSALGITKDHKLILMTTGGATIAQLAEMMRQAGAYQAMNLDGGASSGLYYNGAYVTTPGRQISNALVVRLK
ncbi:phosphodiester glycosidase family protein [Paenibacillus lemnae]|uniref:Copper amine oxidase n=1 Tax=Paenibacillus lemnae TaxID=1330551 RepID=A0A848MEL7_PAELE|nr:phosphodiester glycosidase family protein [Paenibacillus lemnae]NMO97834.1 copper amine oxidase [Paenibacillus lemnae]